MRVTNAMVLARGVEPLHVPSAKECTVRYATRACSYKHNFSYSPKTNDLLHLLKFCLWIQKPFRPTHLINIDYFFWEFKKRGIGEKTNALATRDQVERPYTGQVTLPPGCKSTGCVFFRICYLFFKLPSHYAIFNYLKLTN